MVYYLKNWYSYACSESLYCFQPWQAVIAIINNNNNQWKHCGFAQARSSGPLVLLLEVNDGLGRVIHFLSCSVTGALGESAAHVVSALHRSDWREADSGAWTGNGRGPAKVSPPHTYRCIPLSIWTLSRSEKQNWSPKMNVKAKWSPFFTLRFSLGSGRGVCLQSRSSLSLYGWTHSRAWLVNLYWHRWTHTVAVWLASYYHLLS